MKIQFEDIRPDEGSSFRLLLDSRMNDFYYWHHHPEWELNDIRGADGLYCISEVVNEGYFKRQTMPTLLWGFLCTRSSLGLLA